jgi:hypothetical protein
MHINCGVKINGQDPKSKKAIKEAMATAPETVEFYATSKFQGFWARGDNLVLDGAKLGIVGPCPFKSRKFYGTVEWTPKGIKIS